jgi:hypothetical protein
MGDFSLEVKQLVSRIRLHAATPPTLIYLYGKCLSIQKEKLNTQYNH